MAELDAESAAARPREALPYSEMGKGYTVFRDGDLLLAKITPCWENGKIGQASLDREIGVGSTEFHVVRPAPQVDARYLMRFLRTESVRATGELRMTGSGGQRRVPVKYLQSLEVPLPPLDEQRRIAAILDHADALRAKRRQVLAHLDGLTQSIFRDMFGDADDFPEQVPFSDVATLVGGRNLVADDSTAASEFRVLKISAVTTGRFRPGEAKALPSGYVPPTEHLVRRGDLLMSRANTTDLVGAVALVDVDATGLVLPDKVWRFVWRSPESEPIFIHALLSSPAMRRRISRLSSGTGGSMKNVSKAKLSRMPMPSVAPVRQREFVDRVEAIFNVYRHQRQAMAGLDELFASLEASAFRGEL